MNQCAAVNTGAGGQEAEAGTETRRAEARRAEARRAEAGAEKASG